MIMALQSWAHCDFGSCFRFGLWWSFSNLSNLQCGTWAWQVHWGAEWKMGITWQEREQQNVRGHPSNEEQASGTLI